MLPIEITKTVFGGYRIGYNCPHCHDRLRSPLADAGTQDVCPHCNMPFVVPGATERDQIEREKQVEQEQKRQVAKQSRELKEKKQQESLVARARSKKEAELRRQQESKLQPIEVVREPARQAQPPAEIKCPRCRSTQITANKKGLQVGKAAVGGILLGPVGLLYGMVGSNKVQITCLACGHVFEPGQTA